MEIGFSIMEVANIFKEWIEKKEYEDENDDVFLLNKP